MGYKSLGTSTLIILLLAGCATLRVPFPESELAGLELKGDAVISGKIFLVDQFEDEQLGAETSVVLEPVTSYSDQWYEVRCQQKKSLTEADPRYEQYLKRVISDKEGKFSIAGVAPGEYLLSGAVFWEAITCSGNVAKTEIPIGKKISVKPGDKELEVFLTRKYNSPTVACDLYNQSEWNKDDWEW